MKISFHLRHFSIEFLVQSTWFSIVKTIMPSLHSYQKEYAGYRITSGKNILTEGVEKREESKDHISAPDVRCYIRREGERNKLSNS